MFDITTIIMIRRSKIIVVLLAALFGLTTLANNFTDYAAYAEYIGRIINMSATEGNESRRYRAITSTLFHHRFYWAIITIETIFTLSFLIGTYQLLRTINAPHNEFHDAKKFAIAGFTMAIFVYQTFYVIILNEWFDLEYSAQRSAFDWARNNIEYMFLGLVYLVGVKDS
jgi:predicted small integral membrane protein